MQYEHLRMIVHPGLDMDIEWVSLEDCEKEVAEAKEQQKSDRKKRAALHRAERREEKKLNEAKKRLALAKLALLKSRR